MAQVTAELPAELARRLGALEVTLRNASKQFQPTDFDRQTLLNDIDPEWQTRPHLFFVRLLIERELSPIDAFLSLQPTAWVCTEQWAASDVLISRDDDVLLRRFLQRGVLTSSMNMILHASRVGDRTFRVLLEFLPTIDPAHVDPIAERLILRQRPDLMLLWRRRMQYANLTVHMSDVVDHLAIQITRGRTATPRMTVESYLHLVDLSTLSPYSQSTVVQLLAIALEYDAPLFYYHVAHSFGRDRVEKALAEKIRGLSNIDKTALIKTPTHMERILYWMPEVRQILETERRLAFGDDNA